MLVQVTLVDINPRMVAAWRATFEENPEVTIVRGSMLQQVVDAWVSPTNALGSMDGGLDAIIKNHLGAKIQTRVQQEIARAHGGFLPVGHATCVPTGADVPRYLISTPTMHASSQDISDTLNVALACAAAFQAVQLQNAHEPGSIRSVALPGLGANTGKVPPVICADLMWTGYNLCRAQVFADFVAMRAALEAQLGALEPSPKPQTKAGGMPKGGISTPPPPGAKKADIDFDDAE